MTAKNTKSKSVKCKSNKQPFKTEIIRPMYPFQHGAIRFACSPEAADIDRGYWDEEDLAVIESKAPEAVSLTKKGRKAYSLKTLKAILITDCKVRPQDIPGLDRPTIISLLQQRKVDTNYNSIEKTSKKQRPLLKYPIKVVFEKKPYLQRTDLTHDETEEFVEAVKQELKSRNMPSAKRESILNAKSKYLKNLRNRSH